MSSLLLAGSPWARQISIPAEFILLVRSSNWTAALIAGINAYTPPVSFKIAFILAGQATK
jgi:hypothetical protein